MQDSVISSRSLLLVAAVIAAGLPSIVTQRPPYFLPVPEERAPPRRYFARPRVDPEQYATLRLSPDDVYVLPSQWTDALVQLQRGVPSARAESGQSDEYSYDYDNDWVPVYGSYPEEWYTPERVAPNVETEDRDADLYGDLLVNYILRGWQRQQQETEPREQLEVQRRNERWGRPQFESGPYNVQPMAINEEISVVTESSSAVTSSTAPPSSTEASAAPSSSPSTPAPLRPKITEQVTSQGQKEYPLLRPAKETRRPATSWASLEEQLARAKNSGALFWKSPLPALSKVREDRSAHDALIAQLDSLKSSAL